MAPEQWLGTEIDARSDQFSFCVTFWKALYGVPPFDGDTPQELRAAVIAGRRRSIEGNDRGVPRWLGSILDRGLSTEPAARWPSMAALLDEIDRRSMRRRRAWFAAGGIALVVASGGGAIAAMAIAGNGPSSPRAQEPAVPPGQPDLAAVRKLTQLGPEVCAYGPTIDRDGSVVFDRDEAEVVDLYRVPLAGGTLERLTSTPLDEWRAHAGRRAGEVVFLAEDANRTANSSIAWLDLATGVATTAAEVYARDAVAIGDAIFYAPFEGLEYVLARRQHRQSARGSRPPRSRIDPGLGVSPRHVGALSDRPRGHRPVAHLHQTWRRARALQDDPWG